MPLMALLDLGAVAIKMIASASGIRASGNPSWNALSTHALTMAAHCGYAKPISSLAMTSMRRAAEIISPASSSRAR